MFRDLLTQAAAPSDMPMEKLREALSVLFDADWYLERYPDVARAGFDPLDHFIRNGVAAGLDPNPYFDSAWYRAQYPDVGGTGIPPLLHYVRSGAEELRNPHPRFDAAWYARQHPEAAGNPLLFHLRAGAERGYLTEKPVDPADWLPARASPLPVPRSVAASVVIPVYRGLEQTRRCLFSVLADDARLPGEVIVIDDASPEPELSAWLDALAEAGRIRLIRHPRNLGFVAAANRGIREAGRADVILLNSDTEVPRGWTRRLAAHAYAGPRIASVSPFSNRATICSYPTMRNGGGPPAFGLGTAELDAAAQEANPGRGVDLPTTVGFCMYVRRAALDEAGGFDEARFGRGYGEENDFCMRAARRGWKHRLACDVFVYHEGETSFGPDAPELARAQDVLRALYSDYPRAVAQHVADDPAASARFALTLALFRRSGLPCLLLVSHRLGGGVGPHVDELVARLSGTANVLLLCGNAYGVALSVPALTGHPELTIASDRLDDLAGFLAAVPVARAHIHHTMDVDFDLHLLLRRLRVRFDATLHDWFALCPQVTMQPHPDARFCSEPGPATCNACIATFPSHGAAEILSWRARHAWLFREAERVFCPSEDSRARLLRFHPEARAVLAPHESVPAGAWTIARPPAPRGDAPLRVAMLGVLAGHKGAAAAIALAETADPAEVALHLIGAPETALPPLAARRIACTGAYHDAILPALIARHRPHVLWFPARWPETYSYTLSAAIGSGLPIVASRIGALPERLAGRPLTWLCDPEADTAEWLRVFAEVRAALAGKRKIPPASRSEAPDQYAEAYAVPLRSAKPAPRVVDLRRPGRMSVVVVPETFDNGTPTPCAYIRLLQPLDHPEAAEGVDVTLADPVSAQGYRADAVVTQRYAVADAGAAERLAAHCRRHGTALVYDLDDDLLAIPRGHPEHAVLAFRAESIARMLGLADTVTVSTEALRARLARRGIAARVVPNALDERLWRCFTPAPPALPVGVLRILYMGTATHDADFALVAPALERLIRESKERIAFDMIGVSAAAEMPQWVTRIQPTPNAASSYPGFVNWIAQQRRWHIGIAPLADSPFNRCKSAIKTMDYAALGLAVVASDTAPFRDSLAAGPGGLLAVNAPEAWHAALARLTNDPALRLSCARGAVAALEQRHTLAAQAEGRRRLWETVIGPRRGKAR